VNAPATTYQKWQTSYLRLVFLALAGGIASFHLIRFIFGIPYLDDGQWFPETLVAGAAFLVGYIFNLIIHETAHAVAAAAVGGVVYQVEIGVGKTLCSFQFWGWKWRLRSFPSSGITLWGPTSLEHPRLQRFAVVAAGMLATLLVFLGLLVVLGQFNLISLAMTPERWWVDIAGGVLGSTLWLLCGVWTPGVSRRENRRVTTDALTLILLPWKKDTELREQVDIHRAMREALEFYDASQKDSELAVRNATDHPQDIKAVATAAYLLRSTNDPRALQFAQQALALTGASDPSRKVFLDLVITSALDSGKLNEVPNAPLLIEEMLALNPQGLGNRATHAAGLIDLGRTVEGEAILGSIITEAKIALNLAYCHIFLAIAQKGKGDESCAREHAQKAALLFPQCPALKRVSDLLDPVET
jgi:hypothetical protein